jgi:atypical dual specificity phosphatase
MLSFTAPTWQPTQTAELARATREKRKPAASAILPGRLFLADFLTASDVATLRRLKVTHILSVLESGTPTLPKDLAPTVQTLHVNVADTPEADLLGHLPETTEWITRALEDKSAVVLVHCMMVRLLPLLL